jgi:hypothetical protein
MSEVIGYGVSMFFNVMSHSKLCKEMSAGSKFKVTLTHTARFHKPTFFFSVLEGMVAKIRLVVKVTACIRSLQATVRICARENIFPSPPLSLVSCQTGGERSFLALNSSEIWLDHLLLFSAEPDDSVGGASVLCRHTF